MKPIQIIKLIATISFYCIFGLGLILGNLYYKWGIDTFGLNQCLVGLCLWVVVVFVLALLATLVPNGKIIKYPEPISICKCDCMKYRWEVRSDGNRYCTHCGMNKTNY